MQNHLIGLSFYLESVIYGVLVVIFGLINLVQLWPRIEHCNSLTSVDLSKVGPVQHYFIMTSYLVPKDQNYHALTLVHLTL